MNNIHEDHLADKLAGSADKLAGSADKLALYQQAKDTYYNSGESIMSDLEFDTLEQELLLAGLIELDSVGTDEVALIIGDKVPHLTPMLSIAKVQVFTERFERPHYDQAMNLFNRQGYKASNYLTMFKLDGCSISVQYSKGIATCILTRHNGREGFNIINKLGRKVQTYQPNYFTGELRGEAIMRKSIFNQKYASTYKNPRNLVSGILNDEDPTDPRLYDVDLIFFDARGTMIDDKGDEIWVDRISQMSDHVKQTFQQACTPEMIHDGLIEFQLAYDKYLKEREELDYPTDGIVVKQIIPNFNHTMIKHNGHDPFNVIAIKFPPKETTTKIIRIDWQLNKTGRYTPVGILEPVDLDGSIVKRVSLHNLDNVVQKKLYPGTEIAIAKNGDIIPAVQRVIAHDPFFSEDEFWNNLPPNTRKEGAYLVTDIVDDKSVQRIKFIAATSMLGFDSFAGSSFSRLFDFTAGDWTKLFDDAHTNFNTLSVIFNGESTRIKLLNHIARRKQEGFHIHTLIMMLGINQLGHTTAWQLANRYSGVEHSFRGLDKSVIAAFDASIDLLNDWIAFLSSISVVHLCQKVEEPADQITFEMTGDVNVPGLRTKADFVASVPNWKHLGLKKDTTYLVTDDLNSTTGKMRNAAKFGTKILTYQQALELYKSHN